MATKKKLNKTSATVEDALSVLEGKYGKGMIKNLGEIVAEDSISTGSFGLNKALGCGGYPRGRIIEAYGMQGSGKSTLALHAIAEMQRAGGKCAYIDMEHALDPVYAAKLGVDVNALLFTQPEYGEQALEIAEVLVKSGDVDFVVIDSVAALVPKAELEGDMEDHYVGTQARMMGKGLRKIVAAANISKCSVYFINQLRDNIGAFLGPKKTTTGGKALQFMASIRLEVTRVKTIKDKDGKVLGSEVVVKVTKNKVGPPYTETKFDLLYSKGIDRTAEVFDYAVNQRVITKTGHTFSFGEVKVGVGRDASVAALNEDPDLLAALEAALDGSSELLLLNSDDDDVSEDTE